MSRDDNWSPTLASNIFLVATLCKDRRRNQRTFEREGRASDVRKRSIGSSRFYILYWPCYPDGHTALKTDLIILYGC